MGRWADYLISEVQYDFQRKRIQKIKRHLDRDDTVALPNIISRSILISDLRLGTKYKTIYKNEKDEWTPGNEVMFIEKKGIITIDPNISEDDYLGKLPEF